MDSRRSADRWLEVFGVVGFSALTVAILVAHANPATEYELSIYAATPATFWVGVAVAFAAALVVSLWASDGWLRLGGLLMGGLAALAVVSLPIVRGYFFEGLHDPLTHVGWARAMVEGEMLPHELHYPALHTLGAFVEGVTGFSTWRSMMLVPRAVVLVYFVFVALVVREVVGGRKAATIGAFSAFLLIPSHHIANHVHAHPSSQTILLAPLAVYLLVRYLDRGASNRRPGLFTAFGFLLTTVAVGTVLFHPQQALNLVVVLVAICVVHFVAARRPSLLQWPDRRPVYSIAAVSLVVYLAWVFRFSWIPSLAQETVSAVMNYGRASPEAGSAIDSQTFALQSIGASLPVVFLKLFFVNTVFILLTGAVLYLALRGRIGSEGSRADANDLVRILGAGLFALFPIFVVYLLGDVSVYYFRQAGFMTMLGTIFGAVGIAYGLRVASRPRYRGAVWSVVIVGLAVMLALSTLILFPSPYIHKSNQHVTEARVSGYEAAFEYESGSPFMAGVRQEPERYHEALVSMNETVRLDGRVNSTEIHNLTRLRGDDWFLFMSQNTYEREIVAYEEYRYSRSDLQSVRRQPGVGLVYNNGDAELYHVRRG